MNTYSLIVSLVPLESFQEWLSIFSFVFFLYRCVSFLFKFILSQPHSSQWCLRQPCILSQLRLDNFVFNLATPRYIHSLNIIRHWFLSVNLSRQLEISSQRPLSVQQTFVNFFQLIVRSSTGHQEVLRSNPGATSQKLVTNFWLFISFFNHFRHY